MVDDRKKRGTFFAPDHGEISGADLTEMPDEYKEDFVQDWFLHLYEDPANQTPFESEEGGYQYIWGGPFSAREELEAAFSGIVPEDVLENLILRLERGGDEWAPTEQNPKHHAFEERSDEELIPDENDDSDDGLKRYEHPTDETHPLLTPDRIKDLSDEDQMRLMAGWFFHLHEDLQVETPYDGREGGYLYIHGGPYDAREVLEEEFREIADADIIEKAISYVESDGTSEWAPSPNHPERIRLESEARASVDIDEADHPISTGKIFRANSSLGSVRERNAEFDHDQIDARIERGVRTSFGTSYERAVRRSTLAHAADLQALLAKPEAGRAKHGGIGHNQPPSDVTLDAEHSEQLKVAVETINEELNAELRNKQPDVRKVSRAARTIQSIGKWVAEKLDMTLETFLKSLAAALGTSAAAAITAAGLLGYDPVVRKAMELYQSVVDWLNAVVLPM